MIHKLLKCPLCNTDNLREILPEKDPRNYFLCETCFLIFVHPDFHLSRKEEKSRYEYHKNGINQPGYVKFLNKAIEPTLPYLQSDMVGLDYGCGPNPTLSQVLAQKGFNCHDYDPIFGFRHPLNQYDFIFATECFEHFINPSHEIENISSILKSHGFLSIMTERWNSLEQFKSWYYIKDPTHVSFFHQQTFNYLSIKLNMEIVYQDNQRVIIFKKLSTAKNLK